jgi:hypothetical protein
VCGYDFSGNTNVAVVGVLQATNEPECGGFATAAGAEERKKLTGMQGQTQVVDRQRGTKTFGHVLQFDTRGL